MSENVFSEISQNTQENTFAQASFLIKLQDYEIFKNTFFYRTSLMSASALKAAFHLSNHLPEA